MSKGHTKFDQWITFRLANASMILTGKLVVALARGGVSMFAGQRARGLVQKRSRMIRASDGQGKGGRGKW